MDKEISLLDLFDKASLNARRAESICVSLTVEDHLTYLNGDDVAHHVWMAGDFAKKAHDQIEQMWKLYSMEIKK